MASVGDAAAVLDDAMAMCVCKGAMSDNEFRQMLPVLTVKQQAATYTNGLYVFSTKCSGKVLSDGVCDRTTVVIDYLLGLRPPAVALMTRTTGCIKDDPGAR
ncbi:hypothetical protein MRX96_047664 [Rhipicephalus microplus]